MSKHIWLSNLETRVVLMASSPSQYMGQPHTTKNDLAETSIVLALRNPAVQQFFWMIRFEKS